MEQITILLAILFYGVVGKFWAHGKTQLDERWGFQSIWSYLITPSFAVGLRI